MHRLGHEPMTRHFARRGQFAGERLGPAGAVRRDAAAHQQPGAAARTRGEIRRELREIARAIFQPGVHRTHDDAIRQAREAQIEWGKQPRVLHDAVFHRQPELMSAPLRRRLLARDLRHQLPRERVFRRDQQRTLQRLARADHVAHVEQRAAEERIGFGRAPFRRASRRRRAPASNITVTARSFLSAAAFSSASLPARSNMASASTSRTRGFFGSSFTASSMREPMRPPPKGKRTHLAARERAGRGRAHRPRRAACGSRRFHRGRAAPSAARRTDLVDFVAAVVDGVLGLRTSCVRGQHLRQPVVRQRAEIRSACPHRRAGAPLRPRRPWA